jgi:hypothetical protein
LRGHENSGGAGDRGVADDGADGGNFAAGARERVVNSGTARIGPMLVMGLLGAISTASAEVMASMTPGAGSASEAPAKRTEITGS